MQNDVLRHVTLFSMLVVPDVCTVQAARSVVLTIRPVRPTATQVVVPGRHEIECRYAFAPAPEVWRTQFAPPSVVVMIGGSVLGIVWPVGTTYRPEATQVEASEHEMAIRPANGFGPPEPGTEVPGVVTGVVCHVQLEPPSEVLRTCA